MKKFIAVRLEDKKIVEGFGVCWVEEFGKWILFTKSIKYINDMDWEVESYEVIDITTLSTIV
jgi:hypothetical protein